MPDNLKARHKHCHYLWLFCALQRSRKDWSYFMIHQYKLNNFNIVLDIMSGSIHVVDDVMYDIISMYETQSKDEIIEKILSSNDKQYNVTRQDLNECFEEITTLKNNGKLFAKQNYSEIATDYKNKSKVIKALCLHVAHTCNLNCSYCFAAQGKFNGEDALMSFETGKRALDFLIENSGTRKNLEVDFFGGEPLVNWSVVKQLNKNFRFTLTTNGVLVNDDVINFANKHMHNVVLSFDGRKHVHDNFRKDINGNGSYEKILPKFKKFVDKREHKGYYMRATFTHENIDFTNDILHMADLGFTQLSMEPVVCDENDAAALTKEDLPIILNEYEKLAIEMLKRQKQGNSFEFYHYMLDLKNGPCVYKRITGCASGTEYMAVTPWGELFPCHQFVADREYLLGDIWKGVTNKKVQDSFRSCNIYSREECKTCWANMYCSGGCAANSYHATGDINGIYEYGCTLFKKRIECAIMMHIANAI